MGAGTVWVPAVGVDDGLAAVGCWLEQAAARRHALKARATIRAVLKLAAGRWALAVIPERGGRIASLRLDGEELLDQGIGVDQPTAKGFVEGGAWGWDEMVPTLEPTDTLPDHGEAWRLPWSEVMESSSRSLMQCSGRVLPWQRDPVAPGLSTAGPR